jgi:hypothetical protein
MASKVFQIKKDVPTKLPPVGPPSDSRSDGLHVSDIHISNSFRSSYLSTARNNPSIQPPPLISCSHFVPRDLVALLMRKKKDGALGVKFVANRGDEVTNMEGAMHTFVTPVLPRCEMYGDYRFSRMHGIDKFGEQTQSWGGKARYHTTRTVVLSDSIQMDFENREVMLKVCKLGAQAVIGRDLLMYPSWKILDSKAKQNTNLRNEYDEVLRQHMVYHLTQEHKLPSIDQASQYQILSTEEVIEIFENEALWQQHHQAIQSGRRFLRLHNNDIVSLELLFNTAVHQARNEVAALEVLCPQGYVYTYDPAAIFAAKIGPKILNRLMVRAILDLNKYHDFLNMRVFAFNDYADKCIIKLLDKKLYGQPARKIMVVSKEELFRGPGGSAGLYNVSHIKEAEGAMLVIHNNSDAFGQNIETESMSGSLDGAIGTSSSAAAGLDRSRKDLLDYCWFGEPGWW